MAHDRTQMHPIQTRWDGASGVGTAPLRPRLLGSTNSSCRCCSACWTTGRLTMSRWTCFTCCWGDRGRAERWLRCPRPRWCESSATTRRRFSMSRIAELHFLLHVPMESAATELVRTRRSSIQVHAGPDLNRPKRMRTANMTCISDRQASHRTTPGDTVYHGSAQSAGSAEHTD